MRTVETGPMAFAPPAQRISILTAAATRELNSTP